MCNKILIVDDHKDVTETVSLLLKRRGHFVEVAFNGRECFEKVEKHNIALIFLDIMMPDMNGCEVARQLRQKHNKDLKIVYTTIRPKAELDMAYADGFIQKPFGISEILDAVNQHLSNG
jgi:CheY-like chemotaxis protein